MEIKELEKNIRTEVKGNIEYFNVENIVNRVKESLKKSGK